MKDDKLSACCHCGAVNPFAELMPTRFGNGFLCRDEFSCFRRQQMKMGPQGRINDIIGIK